MQLFIRHVLQKINFLVFYQVNNNVEGTLTVLFMFFCGVFCNILGKYLPAAGVREAESQQQQQGHSSVCSPHPPHHSSTLSPPPPLIFIYRVKRMLVWRSRNFPLWALLNLLKRRSIGRSKPATNLWNKHKNTTVGLSTIFKPYWTVFYRIKWALQVWVSPRQS